MQPVRDTATSALRTMLVDQPTNADKVAFAWQIAAGAAIVRASEIVWSPDGTLRVRARDAAWRREIQHARPLIAERLRYLLGPDAVRAIVVSSDAGSKDPALHFAKRSKE
jgi:predicted SPOUT superfamily RNA methylase MTH1